jgi:tRNA-specific 2-thiouridylase
VGLSGGVDSAVSAALLKERKFDVVGIFIKIRQPEFIECMWKEDRMDAMRVAAALEIPFREVDFSEEYKREVVDDMIRAYSAGETPNPDVVCNRAIKFGAFAEWARGEGAKAIATGHYARTREQGGHVELLRGADKDKDQSYFLHRLNQRELSRAIFPVGNLTKAKVRAEARRFNLPVAERPDSQGLCFVGDVSMPEFLSRFISVAPGPVLDEKGDVIGEHEGAALYTVGQRHGFTLGANAPKGPLYVVLVDVAKNALHVSPRRADAARREMPLRDLHWIHRAAALPLKISAQARYREAPVPAILLRQDQHIITRFETPHIGAPGQSLVFYDGDLCLGGGVIG